MKNIFYLSILSLILISCSSSNQNQSSNETEIIGSGTLENGKKVQIVVGDTNNEQVWIDYIKAHNDRDLDKIAEINADDWEGYTADGSVVKGNEAHIEILDNWFKTASPKWEIKWMIANAAENEEGVIVQWLTTGNDYTDVDENGNEIFEHNVHDVQFVDGKIKRINVYSRAKAQDSAEFSY
tara:strand:- start:956 stop:1501 length:546 start_codon:yes stop_codon:yes gene_type:complete